MVDEVLHSCCNGFLEPPITAFPSPQLPENFKEQREKLEQQLESANEEMKDLDAQVSEVGSNPTAWRR